MKSTCCAYRGPSFSPQYPHWVAHSHPITPVPKNPRPWVIQPVLSVQFADCMCKPQNTKHEIINATGLFPFGFHESLLKGWYPTLGLRMLPCALSHALTVTASHLELHFWAGTFFFFLTLTFCCERCRVRNLLSGLFNPVILWTNVVRCIRSRWIQLLISSDS